MDECPDLNKQLATIERLLSKQEYTASARECAIATERALRQAVNRHLERFSEDIQRKVQEEARQRNRRGQGLDGLTMGQMVYLLRDAGFFREWEPVSGKNVSSFQIIDLEKLTQLRNKFMHEGAEATRTEAEFLLTCLRIILETFDLTEPCEMASQSGILSLPKGLAMTTTGGNENMETAPVPFALQKRIVEFLLTLPNLNDSPQQQAFLNSAGLDKPLQDRIRVADPPSQFFNLLVPDFSRYGTLEDGRHALEAILEASKAYVGQEGQAQCAQLLRELQAVIVAGKKASAPQSEKRTVETPSGLQGKTFVPGYAHDLFVSFAEVDDRPRPGAKEGWVTTLIRELKRQLAENLGTEVFELWSPHQLPGHISRTAEIREKQKASAVFILILSRGYLNSDWCQDPKLDFLSHIREFISKGRIFLVERVRLEPDERPAEFEELKGYPFWVEDRPGRPPRTLGDPSPDHDLAYYDCLNMLCNDLAKELRRLKKGA